MAGVEVILNMKNQMERMRTEASDLIEQIQTEHEQETRRLKEIIWRLQRQETEAGEPVKSDV
jgi:MerR family transcriptional regulator, heat shock protein HspR